MNKVKNSGWNDKDFTKKDLAVIIGRFQPVHNGHIELFKSAALVAENVLILVGSSFIARDSRNPFSFYEREKMIINALEEEFGENKKKFNIIPITDNLYNDNLWIASVQNEVQGMLEELGKPKGTVTLIGHHKDHTSWYLDVFPKYELEEIKRTVSLDSTKIRELFFNGENFPKTGMPNSTKNYLKQWKEENPNVFETIGNELNFFKEYKKKWEVAPFSPTFVTTDAVVICNGHILLVKRRVAPGKGLWALPGGFLNQNETIENGILRELKEETSIKVSEGMLKASLKGVEVFDAPNRSIRGRTITHAHLFILQGFGLPKVRGGDDAERSAWFTIDDFYNMSDKMFEDHFHIGTVMINRAPIRS